MAGWEVGLLGMFLRAAGSVKASGNGGSHLLPAVGLGSGAPCMARLRSFEHWKENGGCVC